MTSSPARRAGKGIALAAIAAGFVMLSPPAHAQGSGDEFRIVDCLLPPQIRQLGRNVTYAAARRAVKTSAADCQNRGGEYVVSENANIASALKVWLPAAEEGDTEAQVAVGEIFEKGLGVPPDFEVAALWYEAAALAGSSRAAINLGQLYEQGRGVPQSKEDAAKWYRRAAGLPDLTFEVQQASAPAEPQPDPAAQAELQRLRAENESLRSTIEDRERALNALQDELRALEQRKQADRAALQDQQAALANLQRQLEIKEGEARQSRNLADSLSERQQALSVQQEEMTFLKDTIDALRSESQAMRQALEAQGAAAAEDKTQLRTDLAALQVRILELNSAYERQQGALADKQAALEEARAALAETRAADAERQREIEALRQSIARNQEDLATRNEAIAALEREVARLEAQTASQREEIAALNKPAPAPAAGDALVELIEPQIALTRGEGVLTVPDNQADLLVIGRLARPDQVTAVHVNGTQSAITGDIFRTTIPILKSNEDVEITASLSDGTTTGLSFRVTRPQRTERSAVAGDAIGLPVDETLNFGRYHALVIGNNDYAHLPTLKTAVTDARALAELLETAYGFRVTLLENATRYDILSALNKMRETLTSDDNLLIYYAGHGELDSINDRGHWLPVDAEPNSSANWISNVAVTDIVNAMTVGQLIVIADSCYSGALTRGALGSLAGGKSEREQLLLIRQLISQRSRMVMTSGGLEPVLDGGGGAHSVFAKSLLETLRRNTGILSGKDLHGYVLPQVASAASEAAFRQIPEYAPIKFAGHEAGDFFFVRTLN